MISCIETSALSLLRYNKIVDRLMFIANKRTLYQLPINLSSDTNSDNTNINSNKDINAKAKTT